MTDSVAISRDVIAICQRLGFALAGVCPARPSEFRDELRAWLGAGSHGDMGFLKEDAALREDPRLLTCVVKPGDNRARDGYNDNVLPVKSFIVVADQYGVRGDTAPLGLADSRVHALGLEPSIQKASGRIARYAHGHDYHQVIKKRLHTLSDELRARFPKAGFVSFVDTVPLMERELATLAGLGWAGKNTLLINRHLGSWLFLGGVGTSLDLGPPGEQRGETDHCGSCTRCIDACPTHAITDHRVEATRCISYLTIEHQGLVPEEHHAAIGDWLYGCDVCQDVCPHNAERHSSEGVGAVREEYFGSRGRLPIVDILDWTQADRAREVRLSAMKRVSLEMMKRNALIVAGNELRARPDAALRDRIERAVRDESETALVRETARIVLANLSSPR